MSQNCKHRILLKFGCLPERLSYYDFSYEDLFKIVIGICLIYRFYYFFLNQISNKK